MLVHDIRITNFKAFYGEHVISFPAPTRSRNVYLLGGENGAGKTSIAQAVLLALYGVGSAGLPGMFPAGRDFRRKYEAWLSAARNTQARDERTDLVTVGATFVAERRQVHVKRSFWYSASGKLEEELLEVREDAHEDTDLFAGDAAQDRVALWMPRHLAELIFFDGEQVRSQLGDDLGAVAGALDRLLDLEPVGKLLEDIKRLSRDRRAELLTDGQLQAMQRLESQSAELLTRRNDAEQRARHLTTEEATLTSEAYRVQQALDERLSGNAPLTSQQLELELRSLRERRDELRSRLGRQWGEWLYLAMAPDLVAAAEAAASAERELRKGRERHKIAEEATSSFAEILLTRAEHVLVASAAKTVRSLIADLQAQSGLGADLAGEVGGPSLNSLGDDVLALAEQAAGSVLRRDKDEAAFLAQDLLAVQGRIAQLEADRSGLGGRGLVDQLVSRLQTLNSELSEVRAKLVDVNAALREVEERQGQVTSGLNRLTQRAADSNDASVWLDSAEQLSLALTAYIAERRRLAIRRVERALLKRLQDLLHKRQLVKSVQIDPATYSVTLNGTRGRQIELPSAGEHQLVAMAFAAAILDCSAAPLPMFVDTPLARLDASHRDNVVSRFWPRVGRQVFVLSTDEEVAGALLERLHPHVAQTYAVDHDDATGRSRVRQGSYFESGTR